MYIYVGQNWVPQTVAFMILVPFKNFLKLLIAVFVPHKLSMFVVA